RIADLTRTSTPASSRRSLIAAASVAASSPSAHATYSSGANGRSAPSSGPCWRGCAPALPSNMPGRSVRQGVRSANARLPGRTVMDAIEKKLERAVRLCAERDLGAHQEELALADLRLCDRNSLVEVLFAPGPSAHDRVG